MKRRTKIRLGGVAALCVSSVLGLNSAAAADLGGNCCADLEERIAELEATSAKKGNRKITLQVYGQINADYSYLSLGDFTQGRISQNGNDESFVGFAGKARINKDMTAGYVLEIDLHQLGLLDAPVDALKPGVRQSYWFLQSDAIGAISVGRRGTATKDLNKWSPDKSWLVNKPLSVGSLSDLYLTGIDVPFDGTYTDNVRYDSPIVGGFQLAATWGNSFDIKDSNGNGNSYDVAVRYAEEFKEFSITGSAGYGHTTDLRVNLLGITSLFVPTGDVDTLQANAGVLHTPTGVFVNLNYANQDWRDLNFKLKGYEVTGGLEEHWFKSVGATEVFGTWGRVSFDPDGGSTTDIDYYGLGVVQTIDAAAMDLYAGYRHYDTKDILGDNADVFNAGARVKF